MLTDPRGAPTIVATAWVRPGPFQFSVEVEPTAVVAPVGNTWPNPPPEVSVAVSVPAIAVGGGSGKFGRPATGTVIVLLPATTVPVTRLSARRSGTTGTNSPVVAAAALAPVK